ncbi:hypothetical protein CHS0354_004832 [Potamilus streckersoni]|uniref:Uncharacterized protein n=1 Tax=Potamilus streckersoni TaxID=2493646 RepID=A0AAE0SA00_9BIVA|nr:hypothetical protein CHS0354_004832 [Potamilus streckersoni]
MATWSVKEETREKLSTAILHQNTTYDLKVYDQSFGYGDLWGLHQKRKKGIASTMQVKWKGPCIVKSIMDVTYIIARNKLTPQDCSIQSIEITFGGDKTEDEEEISPCHKAQRSELETWLRAFRQHKETNMIIISMGIQR